MTTTVNETVAKMNAALEKSGLSNLIGFSPMGVLQQMTHCPNCSRHYFVASALAAWDAAWDAAQLALAEENNGIACSLCGQDCAAGEAHLHQGKYIGECCWDERLRATE